jgi:hypothetical protein
MNSVHLEILEKESPAVKDIVHESGIPQLSLKRAIKICGKTRFLGVVRSGRGYKRRVSIFGVEF